MERDKLIRGLIENDTVNLIAITGRELVEKARQMHGLSLVCTAALGRTLLVTSMMGAQLKNETGSISCILKGGGAAGNIVAVGKPGGIVKGYIENPHIELPPAPNGKLDVALAVGWFGEMTVIRDLSLKEPYIGKCEIISGEIAEDFARYFTVSEQQPSLVYLGVNVEIEGGSVNGAGGLILQPLPNCPEEVLDRLTGRADEISKLTTMLCTGENLVASLEKALDTKINVTEEICPGFMCDCSRERLERVLISLRREELLDMIEKDHGAELSCHFCNVKYYFDENDLMKLIKETDSTEE